MLVIRLWNYFRGYVIIKVEGLTLERFINLSIAKNIYLWDIIRHDYTTIEAKISVSGFKELKEVVRSVGCRISIEKKIGYPFVIHKLKSRKMLALGFIIAVTIILYLTSFIWTIEINGNNRISDEKIISFLKQINVEPGTNKNKIQINDIRRELLTKIDDFTFANIEIRGTKLIIEVKEREENPQKLYSNTPCNIVAQKRAVVEKIIAKNGEAVVNVGDIVEEGRVLISGIIKNERLENDLLVHADGIVLGITRYNKVIKKNIEEYVKEETGAYFTTKELKIGEKRIQLINGEIPFDDYKIETERKRVIGSKYFNIPLEIVTYNYKEVKDKKVKYNIDFLKQSSIVEGTQEIMKSIPKVEKILSKDVKHYIDNNILITEISVEVLENIGIEEKIGMDRED